MLFVSLKNVQSLFPYFVHRNILMMASANSMEVGVMGLQEDQISWEQWTQEDAARAELPMSLNKQETFPVGLGLDTSTQHELPWGPVNDNAIGKTDKLGFFIIIIINLSSISLVSNFVVYLVDILRSFFDSY